MVFAEIKIRSEKVLRIRVLLKDKGIFADHEGDLMTVRVIKRYQNRKLYDSEDSNYVTLNDLGQILKLGQDLRVIDNQTKNDITGTTLIQLLHEKQRSARVQPSSELLKEIIRQGDGSFSGYIRLKMATEIAKFEEESGGTPLLSQ